MRKRLIWDKAKFELPFFYYHHVNPKPGNVYCLYGEQQAVRFRLLFKFGCELAYDKRTVRFYNLIPEHTHLWNQDPNDLFYKPNAWPLEMIDCSCLLSSYPPEIVCKTLLQLFEHNITDDDAKVIIIDSIHFCSGRSLSFFLKTINKLARKYKVVFFIAADVKEKLDFDSIYHVKPANFTQLFLYVDFFIALMKHPTSSDIYLQKIWKSRSLLPKPHYKGRGWSHDDLHKVFMCNVSFCQPLTVDYHGSESLPHIFRYYVKHYTPFKK